MKIAPKYDGPVVYVPDASRSVSVAQSLLGDGKQAYLDELQTDYDKVRTQHANKRKHRCGRWSRCAPMPPWSSMSP